MSWLLGGVRCRITATSRPSALLALRFAERRPSLRWWHGEPTSMTTRFVFGGAAQCRA